MHTFIIRFIKENFLGYYSRDVTKNRLDYLQRIRISQRLTCKKWDLIKTDHFDRSLTVWGCTCVSTLFEFFFYCFKDNIFIISGFETLVTLDKSLKISL